MNKPFFTIKNELGTTVIHIDGEIGYDVDYAGFRNAIINLIGQGVKRVKLMINSVGGDMGDGFAMYDFIRSINIIVECEIIGMAASMAGVLAQCASPGMLSIHENALVMTHRPQSTSRGESDNHRTAADLSDKLENKAKAIYVNRGANPDKMKDWFKPGQMKWFTAEEALAAGIVDSIIKGNGPAVKPTQSLNTFKDEVSAFKYFNTFLPKTNNSNMNKLLYAVVLMLNSNGITTVNSESTDDEVVKALNAFETKRKADLLELENKVKNVAKTRATDLVATYKAQGKFPADMKADDETKWLERAEKDPEGFLAMMSLIPGTTPVQAADTSKIPDFNAVLGQANQQVVATAANGTGLPANKKDYTIRQWEEHDPEGLKNMLQNNRPEYHRLFKAFYNAEPFPLT